MSFQSLLQRNYFCNLAFIGVLDMYPNPYFISFFPILLFLMVFWEDLFWEEITPSKSLLGSFLFQQSSNSAESKKILGQAENYFQSNTY